MAHSFPMKLENIPTSSSSHYNPDAFIFIPKLEENDGTTKNNRIGLVIISFFYMPKVFVFYFG